MDNYLDFGRLCEDYPHEIVSNEQYINLLNNYHELYSAAVWSVAVPQYESKELIKRLEEQHEFYISTM